MKNQSTDRTKIVLHISLALLLPLVAACKEQELGGEEPGFQYETEQFADLRILRYRVPGFESLTPKQKELLYYLYQAGLSGRDIIWDQNYRHNLYIRRTLENIVETYEGDRDSADWGNFMVYTKRVWFSSGIHHHYSTLKILPEFTEQYLAELVKNSDPQKFPLQAGETVDDLILKLTAIMFDQNIDAKKVNLDPNVDQIKESATNYYAEDLTQQEVENYYNAIIDRQDPRPVSYGLNSKLVKEKGVIREKVWKVGGMYTEAIEKIIYWLNKAAETAQTPEQKAVLEKLIEYYETGDLKKFDEYNILWVQDTASSVDVINGFIEVYGDPLGFRGAFESVVSFRDMEATKRIDALGKNAQWFENNSTIRDQHKKQKVTGISAKVITVVMESGDSSPSTPIGINLPNANWIRKEHGSKSVNLGNIVYAYDESAKSSGVLEEFAYNEEKIERARKYRTLASNLQTDMHEVIGHASGQIEPGVGTPKETLKSYASTLEEGRADLVALYYLIDQKLVDIGVMPSLEVGRAGYDSYIRNGLMVQLARLKSGEDLEEAHMRNRQMIGKWVYEKGRPDNVIEKKIKDGKTYFVINDYEALRGLFGQLLREMQRIKSTGDYQAGKSLVENFGVKVDPDLHKEVLERYAKLHRAPYGGFINPRLVPVADRSGNIIEVRIEYPEDFTKQMMYYGKYYSFLPTYN
ncbi:dipeptidyl peptidase 3 [Acidobacteria bacterium AH-259-L09]|nr:dipeptidyl peptidase 3 [Acidobacteria bacterium AH-259-L09]